MKWTFWLCNWNLFCENSLYLCIYWWQRHREWLKSPFFIVMRTFVKSIYCELEFESNCVVRMLTSGYTQLKDTWRISLKHLNDKCVNYELDHWELGHYSLILIIGHQKYDYYEYSFLGIIFVWCDTLLVLWMSEE